MLLGPLALASFVALAASAGACSGVDETYGDTSRTTTPSPTEPTPSDASTATPDGAGGTDAGAIDAATEADAAKPKDAFEGTAAYAAQAGPTTRQAGHNFNANTPKTNPAGRPCLNCHDGTGNAPAFAAGGTVYAGAKPAASAEVRVVGADGIARSAYTDADGNFFFRAATQDLDFPALAGARNATATKLMTGHATKGNCNECHSIAGGAGKIVVTP